MVFIFLGPPGSGKGTQGRLLSERLGISYLSSGDILRDLSKGDGELALEIKSYMIEGKLIPDSMMRDIFTLSIKEALLKTGGVILDGYPRTVNQARDLELLLQELSMPSDLIKVIELTAGQEEIVARLDSRYICPYCQRVYHRKNQPPKVEGRCDFCSSLLVKRQDDKGETIRERLREYELKTRELHNYFSCKGLLLSVSGEGKVEEVAREIEMALGNWEARC